MFKISAQQKLQYFMLGIISLFISILLKILPPKETISQYENLINTKLIVYIENSDKQAFIWGKLSDASRTKKIKNVKINTAQHEELLLCPGIGSLTAHKILLEREKNGKFTDWADFIKRVPRIATCTVEKLIKAGVKLE